MSICRQVRSGAVMALLLGVTSMAFGQECSTAVWPSFRGVGAKGVAVGQNLPAKWDVSTGSGVRWKTRVPGLSNASPIVWGNRLFVTTAVSSAGDDALRIGLYGAGDPVADESEHKWKVLCLSARDGRILWERVAQTAIPNVKRHTKSSQANSTPATDGRHVVALFNSGGLYCYDYCGNLLWKRDLGVLDAGAFDLPEFQWGFGSSPVIACGRVIVQCDIQKGSYIAAFNVTDGCELWKKLRDELPAWGSPTVYWHNRQPVIVTNGSKFARGLRLQDGEEVWRLSGNSFITVPTPFLAHDRIYITSGYRPIQPIYAVKTSATGDISLADNETTSKHIAWSYRRGGVYLPTPIVVGNELYMLSTSGILSCFDAKSGERHYRQRIGHGEAASFTASPVAADNKIYFPSEVGVVYKLAAGPEFSDPIEHALAEYCLATPAISGQQLVFRTHRHVVAIGRPAHER